MLSKIEFCKTRTAWREILRDSGSVYFFLITDIGEIEEINRAGGGMKNESGTSVRLHGVQDEKDEGVFVEGGVGIPEIEEIFKTVEFCSVQMCAIVVRVDPSGFGPLRGTSGVVSDVITDRITGGIFGNDDDVPFRSNGKSFDVYGL